MLKKKEEINEKKLRTQRMDRATRCEMLKTNPQINKVQARNAPNTLISMRSIISDRRSKNFNWIQRPGPHIPTIRECTSSTELIFSNKIN